MIRIFSLVTLLFVLFVILLSACGKGELAPTLSIPKPTLEPIPTLRRPTSTLEPIPSPRITAIPGGAESPGAYAFAEIMPASFVDYAPYEVKVQPSLPGYEVDLGRVANLDILQALNDEQRALVEKNGFVVVPSRAPQLYDIYKEAKERGYPIFVTTDAVLHTYHILYDYTLRFAEIEHFVDDLQGLNHAMLQASLAQFQDALGQVQEAAKRNVAFFAVGTKLLNENEDAIVPTEVKDLVGEELALIKAHEGFAPSPIFGYKEDYSQYVPRGHYTRNEAFQRYFKAMMWYGRMMFRLKPGNTPEKKAQGRMETRQAILAVVALQNTGVGGEPALKVWERIYQPTVFFVGKTDDLNVYDYSQVIEESYGDQLALEDLEGESKLDQFIERAMSLRSPKIVSSYVTDREEPEVVIKGFRFMGQRFIPDSYIFQQLVYDKVGTQAHPRLFPKGLDVPAVLGSGRAYEILDEVYGETQYANYDAQLDKLREEFRGLPDEQWRENLYWSWLYSLRPLLEIKGEGYPTFMRTAAWVDKDLNTFLGSWTELRHDTLLYAKQSYTAKVTGKKLEPEEAKGYVEPQPEVYARLAALAKQMGTGLNERDLLNEECQDKLEQMESLLLSLKAMAEKELANQTLSEEEYKLIRDIGDTLESITTFTVEVEQEITSEADERMAIMADVHTDVNTGQVLEEGVGDAFFIYVVVPIESKLVVARGGVFSYYEFTQPMSDRLTDESWQALEPKPELPVWMGSFIR